VLGVVRAVAFPGKLVVKPIFFMVDADRLGRLFRRVCRRGDGRRRRRRVGSTPGAETVCATHELWSML